MYPVFHCTCEWDKWMDALNGWIPSNWMEEKSNQTSLSSHCEVRFEKWEWYKMKAITSNVLSKLCSISYTFTSFWIWSKNVIHFSCVMLSTIDIHYLGHVFFTERFPFKFFSYLQEIEKNYLLLYLMVARKKYITLHYIKFSMYTLNWLRCVFTFCAASFSRSASLVSWEVSKVEWVTLSSCLLIQCVYFHSPLSASYRHNTRCNTRGTQLMSTFYFHRKCAVEML